MYATVEQLARRLQLDEADMSEDVEALTELLEDATGVIDDEIGHSLVLSTDTVMVDGSGAARLLLPRWPVTAVATVTEIAADGTEIDLVHLVDYTWSEAGILTRVGGVWPCRDRSVRAVYTPGHDPIPTHVRKICLRLAAAGRRNPAGADSEDIGDARVRWHTPGMELTTGERNALARYAVR